MLQPKEKEAFLFILERRFHKHIHRHKELEWDAIQSKLMKNHKKVQSLFLLEESGGEPDVVGYDEDSAEYIFFDCSAESPKTRRSLCYDQGAWLSRKEHKPRGNALDMAKEMGALLLTEEEYFHLQELGDFDLKTSSWLRTPANVRKSGGAIFGDKRFGRTFVYHNGAESYYAARGFRCALKV